MKSLPKWSMRMTPNGKNLTRKLDARLVRGRTWTGLVGCRRRAKSANRRQSRPDSGLDLQVKAIQVCKLLPLGSAAARKAIQYEILVEG